MPSFTQLDRFPFDHLSLAQVAQEQRLWMKLARGEYDEGNETKLAYLSSRRVRPLYPIPPKGPEAAA